MRQLVTIRTVKELIPIQGADKIELAKVDGWQCVVKKGDFAINDEGIFFEIDSMLPTGDTRWSFMDQRKFRVRSMKLRGALSQGLLLSRKILTREEEARLASGEALTDILGVQKYEPPLPMSGEQKGTFPTHLVPKTDQERIQNVPEVLEGRSSMEFEITEKLDGTSCTIYYHHDRSVLVPQDGAQIRGERKVIHVGVCSRNWEMKLDDDNVYSKIVHDNDLVAKLTKLDRNIALQGEIIGPGVQGNKYKRAKQELYIFDIYDIDNQCYLSPFDRRRLCKQLEIMHVPVIEDEAHYAIDLDDLLNIAEGYSVLHKTQREGLVFKAYGENFSFKVISNKFLLKNE